MQEKKMYREFTQVTRTQLDLLYAHCLAKRATFLRQQTVWNFDLDSFGLEQCITKGPTSQDLPNRTQHLYRSFYEWESWKFWSDRLQKEACHYKMEQMLKTSDKNADTFEVSFDAESQEDRDIFHYLGKAFYVYLMHQYNKCLQLSFKP